MKLEFFLKMSYKKLEQNKKIEKIEIESFLRDVYEYFKASLETSEYENSSNPFYVTEAKTTAKLLQRCEILLQKFDSESVSTPNCLQNEEIAANDADANYIDMNCYKNRSSSHEQISKEYLKNGNEMSYSCSESLDSCDNVTCQQINEKTREALNAYANETFKKPFEDQEDSAIYDTCIVSQYSLDPIELKSSWDDCPFRNLPASYLEKNKSAKYGYLQRIEKRYFFDQSKRLFCGIMNDSWFLCYAEATACHPNYFLNLKKPGIHIEHSGEGKRRDICFQITTGDALNEKIIFQAANEVDAKEWIHAIEAAKSDFKKNRSLPTPPIIKKITFLSHENENNTNKSSMTSLNPSIQEQTDRIYEEPSLLYDLRSHSNQSIQSLPKITKSEDKFSLSTENLSLEFYDTPKSPPKPVEKIVDATDIEDVPKIAITNPDDISSSAEVIEFLNHSKSECESSPTNPGKMLNDFEDESAISPTNSQKIRQSLIELADKIDIQAKVKDLHSKLSSQLLSPISPPEMKDRLQKKAFRKAYTDSSNGSAESVALRTSPTFKQKASNNDSMPKNNIINHNENSITNNNEKPSKSWFLKRFQKTTSSMRGANSTTPTFAKCRQSEKENLLDACEQITPNALIENKSKVSMIINRLEASGGHKAMICINTDDCNTYEPMMTVSSVLTTDKSLKKI